MPIPNLPCVTCLVPPATLELPFPGGVTLIASLPNSIVPNSSELARQMFAQVNSALAPLMPIFNVLDAITTLKDCVTAVPKAILSLDPTPLIECAPKMLEAVSKLASLIPPLSLPSTLRGIIDTMIVAAEGLREELEGAKLQLDRLLEAGTASQLPGNSPLIAIVVCAQSFYNSVMQHTANTATPLNKLIGVVNLLLSLIPGDIQIPCIGGLDGSPSVVQGILEKFIAVLKIIRAILPGGLKLNVFVPVGPNCT